MALRWVLKEEKNRRRAAAPRKRWKMIGFFID
jgi:hypothetical protein